MILNAGTREEKDERQESATKSAVRNQQLDAGAVPLYDSHSHVGSSFTYSSTVAPSPPAAPLFSLCICLQPTYKVIRSVNAFTSLVNPINR